MNGWAVASSYRSYLSKAVSIDTEVSLERLLDYARLEPAMVTAGEIELELFPIPSLRTETLVQLQNLRAVSGENERATLIRNNTQWQLTKEWGLRVIVEHADTSSALPRLTTSILGTWLRHPGTALWFGYVESAEALGSVEALNRGVFLKGTILFRP